MRTTLTLDDDVARFLKEQARISGSSFKQVVNDSIRRAMVAEALMADRPAFEIQPYEGDFLPGIDLLRSNQMNDELLVEAYAEKSHDGS